MQSTHEPLTTAQYSKRETVNLYLNLRITESNCVLCTSRGSEYLSALFLDDCQQYSV
jgi:hypothetical protein